MRLPSKHALIVGMLSAALLMLAYNKIPTVRKWLGGSVAA